MEAIPHIRSVYNKFINNFTIDNITCLLQSTLDFEIEKGTLKF